MSESDERRIVMPAQNVHETDQPPREPIHIIGVGGSATRGLACFLRSLGHAVTGSDQDPDCRSNLEDHGVTFHEGHSACHLADDVRIVVHTRAIRPSNPELLEARKRPEVKIYTYSEYLGLISERMPTIAVAGTHGKTSTTACLFSVFQSADRDPSMIVGGEVVQIQAGWHQGTGTEFLVEACEFDKAFLDLKPKAAIITNVDLDHPEIYKDLESVRHTFREFLANLEDGSWVVCPVEVKKALKVDDRLRWRTFGVENNADLQLKESDSVAGSSKVLWRWTDGREFTATLHVPGAHTRSNASAVVAMSEVLNLSFEDIARGLESYRGVCRRFEKREVLPGIEWIEDYAHHPEEVRATVETAREVYPNQRIHALFQPHQATRLSAFRKGFAEELSRADQVTLLPIFSVREELDQFPRDLVDQLAAEIRQMGKECQVTDFENAVSELPKHLQSGDVLISIGAGNVYQVGNLVRENQRSQVTP